MGEVVNGEKTKSKGHKDNKKEKDIQTQKEVIYGRIEKASQGFDRSN